MNKERIFIQRVITENPGIIPTSNNQQDKYVIMEALHEFRSKFMQFPDIRRSLFVIVGLSLGPLLVYQMSPATTDKLVSIDRTRGMIESYIGALAISSLYLLVERIKITIYNKQIERNTKAWMHSEGLKPNPVFDYLQLG